MLRTAIRCYRYSSASITQKYFPHQTFTYLKEYENKQNKSKAGIQSILCNGLLLQPPPAAACIIEKNNICKGPTLSVVRCHRDSDIK